MRANRIGSHVIPLDMTSEAATPGFFESVEECTECEFFLEGSTRGLLAGLGDGGRAGHLVDLACGVGEPGLSLLRAGYAGRLTGIDTSPQLIEAARQRAADEGFAADAHFVVGDMDALEFADASVDAVVSRMGALLLGDPARTAREIGRILVPGGRFSIAAWAEMERHPIMVLTHDALLTCVSADQVPDLSGWFRQMATPGVRSGWMHAAGLSAVEVEPFEWACHFPDFESCWSLGRTIWRSAMTSLDDGGVRRVRSALQEALQPWQTAFGDGYVITTTCQIVSGERPGQGEGTEMPRRAPRPNRL